MAFFEKFKKGLSKTRERVFGQIQEVLFASRKIDDELLEEIEDLLISGDVGVETSLEIIERIKKQALRQKLENSDQLFQLLKEEIKKMFADLPAASIDAHKPHVILVVGVNGTGKTTSIAKLARLYKEQGKDVLLVAADTFRAAAIEQLQIWADRVGVDIIKHQSGADPAAVVYDAMQAAIARKKDVVIVDTAGRLHTKVNLMEELKKVNRVIKKVLPDAPHQTALVLDGTTGQNAISQARQFIDAVGVNGIILTKLDGTAKGGAIIGISHQLKLPVLYVGLGEQMDDLQPFDPDAYVESLFEKGR
ncbi:MAG: signal recognition particle-docking protein FtsY [Calditrichia bacterium]